MDPNFVQGLLVNSGLMIAAATVLGAVVVFLLLYLVLERKKKTLIVVFLVILTAFGLFYWRMSRQSVAQLDLPKPIITEPMPVLPPPAPRPIPNKPHPRATMKKAAVVKPKPPLQICPKQSASP
jgi:hypothetical protein